MAGHKIGRRAPWRSVGSAEQREKPPQWPSTRRSPGRPTWDPHQRMRTYGAASSVGGGSGSGTQGGATHAAGTPRSACLYAGGRAMNWEPSPPGSGCAGLARSRYARFTAATVQWRDTPSTTHQGGDGGAPGRGGVSRDVHPVPAVRWEKVYPAAWLIGSLAQACHHSAKLHPWLVGP